MEVKYLQTISNGIAGNFPLFIYWEPHQGETAIHSHDFVELVLVYSGKGTHVFEGTRIPIRQGDVFVIPQTKSHGYQDCSDDLRIINFLFVPELLPLPTLDVSMLPGYKELYFGAVNPASTLSFAHVEEPVFSFICMLAKELYHENETREPGYLFNMFGLFIAILGKLARIFSNGVNTTKHSYIKKSNVISYLNLHFKESISISTLCKIAGMSKPAMMRNFARMTGSSPRQYQIHLRISEASVLLRTSDKSTSEIAFEVGFTDCNYFGRQFKRITGKTPGAYRKSVY